MAALAELQTSLKSKLEDVNALYDLVGEGDPTNEQMKAIKDLNKEIEELEHKAKDRAEYDGIKVQNVDRLKRESNGHARPHQHTPPGGDGASAAMDLDAFKSLGERYTTDPNYVGWLKGVAPDGQVPTGLRLTSPNVQCNDLLARAETRAQHAAKALITSGPTSAGATVWSQRIPGVVPLPFAPLVIRDIISSGTTNTDTIDYAQVTGYTNAAAAVPEATAITAGGTGVKPESAMVLAKVVETVSTIAHWIPATRRALSDSAQIRSLIDAFLRDGLNQRLEQQIITGDNVGENLHGYLLRTGITVQAYDTDILITTRKARTKVKTVGRATPNAYVMHPADWERFDLLKDNEARYYFGGPQVLGNPRLWGLPVVESEGMPIDTFSVGDHKQIMLFDRQQATMYTSDSHADFFIKNLVAILAELRAALAVFQPPAIVKGDLGAVP